MVKESSEASELGAQEITEKKQDAAKETKVSLHKEAELLCEKKSEKKKQKHNLPLLGKWDLSTVVVNDPGLKSYINVESVLVPKTYGRSAGKQFHKSKKSIIERLANKLIITGHRGKKHVLTSGKFGGKNVYSLFVVKRVMEKIERETKKNPVQVIVDAIQNAALLEEITSYQLGSRMVRKAVVTSPQRRIDWALRLMSQGAYHKAFNNKVNSVDALASEIMACYQKNSQGSYAIRERDRIEREAEGAR